MILIGGKHVCSSAFKYSYETRVNVSGRTFVVRDKGALLECLAKRLHTGALLGCFTKRLCKKYS